MYPVLRRNDKGEEVQRLQSLLNRVGAMLVADGDFGLGTERGVRYGQHRAGLPETGFAEEPLWRWLEGQPEPYPLLDVDGVALIAREETGGLAYYQQVTRWPHYPGSASGITIGIGYDLRFNSEDDLRVTWGPHLPQSALHELIRDIGKRGSKARERELQRLGIEIPFVVAWQLFIDTTLPRFYTETARIYPSLPHLSPLCRAALVSLVYNRGAGLIGPTRLEMRAIRDILVRADDPALAPSARLTVLAEVEEQFVAMQRLWPLGSGLRKRRQAEANLWREGLTTV
ncbi:MAG: peptidoglycan-binding protein [Thermodesulfobacteriota bacterium]